ncbi:MAG: class I SAM-dependent methyltransferase [Spirochaetes bacterium]|nr:class I SAM-dependent methyltransferase [Spirochaetota bacterium]
MPVNDTKATGHLFEKPLEACPLCGSPKIRRLHRIERFEPAFTVDRCASCGFIFTNPRLTHDAMTALYGRDYYTGASDYSYYDERETEQYARHVWDSRCEAIHRFIHGGNILDVGSSFGGFLKSASKYYRPHGIEVSSYAGGYSISSIGPTIHIGTLKDHPFEDNYFSVISMIELLEHLPDPLFALRECHRLLRDGGLLLIQTANMAGLQARLQGKRYGYYLPGHCSYFTKKNLMDALTACGFSRIKAFHPVEFGLIPKLKKSRGAFTSVWHYRAWLRIAAYHYISKIRFGNFAATSSMVLYAFK